ncbi:MAG: Omp28-related outer membrane protein [Candidatus Kapabacteria bacterium]|nr:Omp28-related outer membrane protein [Candidatus Kapabacteria bacterium]
MGTNVVLEEFTGIHCGNCPGGHKKAGELAESNPGRVVLLSIHEGYYAKPNSGEPDFRTQLGPAILSQAMVSGFPAGTINRRQFSGTAYPYYTQKANGYAMSPAGWEAASMDSILNGSVSPLNIAAKTRWNNDTRELEVDVEVYFTSDVTSGAKLNIALLESHVWGPQTGASDPKHYEHNHIFRDMLTGQWGEDITETTKGSLFKKTFKQIVSDKFDILNCDLALFVTQSNNKNIYTGIDVQVIPPNANFSCQGGKIVSVESSILNTNDLHIENISDHQITFEISLSKSPDAPEFWEITFQNDLNEITLDANEELTFDLEINTNSVKGVGDVFIEITEKDNPISNPVHETFTIVTEDINYLEINAGGTIVESFKEARNDCVSLPLITYNKVSHLLNQLSAVLWNTGPRGRINTVEADMIEAFIANGIGVLISGSGGIPMLIVEDPSHNLMEVLGVTWSQFDEIGLTNFTLAGYDGDPVSDCFYAPDLSVENNGFMMQPMTITNSGKTTPIIKMEENSKIISVKVQNPSARAIYLSFNPDIIEDIQLKNTLIKNSMDWIEGIVGVYDDPSQNMQFEMQAYPNNLNGKMRIVLKSNNDRAVSGKLFLSDIQGKIVNNISSGHILPGENEFILENADFAHGRYLLVFESEEGIISVPIIK